MIERRIASWFGEGKYSPTYTWVSFDKIAPAMSAAVIASEDQNFPQHFGFDWKAIQKALDHNGRSTRTKGASTLTQQTAKNLFLWSRRSWVRKGFEAYFTLLIESLWNKRRTLETYLNIVEFGDGVYGVEAAAQRYFGKPASKLNASEAALLAAVLPNPRRYSVKSPGPYVRERQQWILEQMEQLGGASMVKSIQ
jgi:monofunctional glycosyltransferase